MNVFENLIKFDDNGQVINNNWIEWRHIYAGASHCEICISLDKCWFNKSIMPMFPQHYKCHCQRIFIPRPVPYVNAIAICDIKKFKDYIFSEKYAWNGKKKLFESLGFSIEDSEFLKTEYEKQAVENYCNSHYTLANLIYKGKESI